MKKHISYRVWPSDLRLEEELGLLEDFASERGLAPHSQGPFLLTVDVDRHQKVECDTLEEWVEYMKHSPEREGFRVCLRYVDDEQDSHLDVDVIHSFNRVKVDVSSDKADWVESAHAMISRVFQLSNPAVLEGDGTREKLLDATVFIGRHFDASADVYSASLQKFLELLDFDVKQGKGYTSQPIPDKVKDRIDSQDIFIVVVSGSGTHEWLTAEPSYALGRDKHVILMVEEGVSYNPTILGQDLEQIRFPRGHIEKTFIPLLEEFTSLGLIGIF